MKKRVKTEWLKALRSGEYEQGQTSLRVRDLFCCLGILCELAHKEGACEAGMTRFGTTSYDESECYLPLSVQKWAGLDTDDGLFRTKEGIATSLAELNDSGKTFEQIANYIERYF